MERKKHFIYALTHDRIKEKGFMIYQISNGFGESWHDKLSTTNNNQYFIPV